jgi:hypothetical protein
MRTIHGLGLSLAIGAASGIARADQPALLIVTPRALADVVNGYAAERRKELPTEVVVLEEALARRAGPDDAERLKRELYERWSAGGHALRYVLLVGDADVLPVRYMVLDRATPAAFDYAFYPSDLYYADLARADGSFDDWNASKEGFHAAYFGEVRGEKNKDGPINFDGVDYRPEVGVGRWPVSTPEEAEIVAAKTLRYVRAGAAVQGRSEGPREAPPPTERPDVAADPAPGAPAGSSDVRESFARPRAALVATGGWIENRAMMDAFAERLRGRFEVEKRYWGDGDAGRGATPGPDEAQIVELLNRGVGLVLHSGHGSDDGWEGSIAVRSIAKLHNEEKPAVMMSAGCSTARLATLPPYEGYVDVHGAEHAGTNAGETFTAPPPPPACYQRGAHNPTGLGERLLRAGGAGAVAYIGCDTGSQPCGMTLMEGFVERLGAGDERLGDCWVGAVKHYWEREHLADLTPDEGWYPPSVFFQGMKFVVFGDPSIRVGE